ncbi:response regulator transcription factor [Saliterribacillus persicus]|uniref:Two-component system response regulator DegU n=1 Tax=Saliterribacillus persicus TaxID=930114 RepID=A0A368YAV7_9BACI|nr:response regulator transcription factor [Saliterribacillus persicus]RCW77383.1 two-component system response regulator DegU [Saliterribacillus persicus]
MRIAIMKEASIFREGLVGVIQDAFPNYNVIAISPKKQEELENYLIDLLIIDIDTRVDLMPLIHDYTKRNKRVVVWTEYMDHKSLVELFKLQLTGYFYNGMEKEELIHAIKKLLKGQEYIHEELAPILLGDYRALNKREQHRPVGVFTNREWDVMSLLIQGYSNERIGNHLYITEKTVKNHISSILRKLNVPDRTNAVLAALKNEWFYV